MAAAKQKTLSLFCRLLLRTEDFLPPPHLHVDNVGDQPTLESFYDLLLDKDHKWMTYKESMVPALVYSINLRTTACTEPTQGIIMHQRATLSEHILYIQYFLKYM